MAIQLTKSIFYLALITMSSCVSRKEFDKFRLQVNNTNNTTDSLVMNKSHSQIPAGTIIAFGGPEKKWTGTLNIPDGWLICDGKLYNINDSSNLDLWNAIGRTWGAKFNDSLSRYTHFRVPDLRGYF